MPAQKTHKQYKCELKELKPSLKLLGTYVNAKTYVEFGCCDCENRWYDLPSRVLRTTGCPVCRRAQTTAAMSKTHEQYVTEVNNAQKLSVACSQLIIKLVPNAVDILPI